ncbi:FAD/NAD(P)-binding protein [Streptomyces sp. NPDC050636]|uniref:FAD/NAD(P)-binding protein n=1 Tax=Streptomyces sp. NPDC050636 TaxID=3154510 RepID=UPI003428DE22
MAVIGGGACGIMACAALVREAAATGRTALDVHLVEKQARLGDGVAYATPYDWHLLNMQAATMSAAPDDPDDFTTWLREQPPADSAPPDGLPHAYVPRHRFAAYLRHRFADTVRAAEHAGIRIEVHRTEILDCHPWGDRLTLECAHGMKLPAVDRIVLSLGDLPSPAYRELTGHPRYHPDPWQLGDNIAPAATVGVLGTGLTAVDALAQLHATGHHGPLHCFSRNRPFPTVQPPVLTSYRLRHLTPERLEQLTAGGARQLSLPQVAALFLQDFQDATNGALGAAQLLHRARTHDGFAADIAEAQAHHTSWYEALDATSQLAPYLWQAMSSQAKTDFLARYHSLWAIWRHPMPLPNARRLHHMHHTGQLHWHTGIQNIAAGHNGGFEAHCHHDDRHRTWHIDHLINATGTSYQPWLTASPLLTALLDRGALAAHPLGGIDVDFHTLQATPKADQRLYYIGPLTRGVHFYTNAIETNLANSARMATHLIRALPPSPAERPAPMAR